MSGITGICANLSDEVVKDLIKFLKFASAEGLVLGVNEEITADNIRTLCVAFQKGSREWKRPESRADFGSFPRQIVRSRTRDSMERKQELESCISKWINLGQFDKNEARIHCERGFGMKAVRKPQKQ